jgi:transposase-like protein
MAKHRSYSVEFKRQVVQDYLAGETLHGLAKRHDISRNLIRIWIAKHEARALDCDTAAARVLTEYEARIAAAGAPRWQARSRERVFKGGLGVRSPAEKREYVRRRRPHGVSVAEGCRLMRLARSTYYDKIKGQPIEEGRLMAHIAEICAEFPRYGYRRITAQLREDGSPSTTRRSCGL